MKKTILTSLIYVFFFAILGIIKVNAQIITTYAGSGLAGYIGDGGPASAAKLHWPSGVAIDNGGNAYVTDYSNFRIRKISSTGIITTIGGNGTSGYSGDGGPATLASLNPPVEVTVDDIGNVYFADFANQRIRKINSLGIISTIAGNGVRGFSGDGGPATDAQLNYPTAVAIDGVGNLYIADATNLRIRKVNTAGVISTIAGNGMDGNTGDGGLAIAAEIGPIVHIALDSGRNIYLVDAENNRIRKISTSGIIAMFAGNGIGGYGGDGGSATNARLDSPNCIVFDAHGNAYIADSYNYRVRMISTAGVISTFAGNGIAGYSGDGGLATDAQLNVTAGVAVDGIGNLYIADPYNNRIRKVGSISTDINLLPGSQSNNISIYPNPVTDILTI